MKPCIIIGDKNCVTYKEVFPIIKSNQVWIGAKPMGGSLWFPTLESHTCKCKKIINGVMMTEVPCCWLTNLDHNKRHTRLDLYKKYSNEYYPKYDNYDAIEVSKVAEIPYDYDGVMGVPISFLDKYNPEQFEIIGTIGAGGEFNVGPAIINGVSKFKRILIRNKQVGPIFNEKE